MVNNTDWNATKWNDNNMMDDDDISKAPIRDMMYQDYWKGYVERQVNQTLNWDNDWTEVMSFVE